MSEPCEPARLEATEGDPTTVCGRACHAGLFLGVGLLAGAVAFVAIARYGSYFQLPAHVERLLDRDELTRAEFDQIEDASRVRDYRNTALSVAILGGVAGGVLGLAAGLRRKTAAAAAGGLIGGVVLGAAFGGLGGLTELFAAYRLWPLDIERTFKTMAAHSTAFLIAGVGIGLGAGLAARRVRHSLGVVLAAALVAGLVYPGLAAFLFPVANTDLVVPDAFGPLLLWTVMPLALMGLALGRTRAPGRTSVGR